MKYEELIAQLCEVIKESENNAQIIYDNTEIIEKIIQEADTEFDKKDEILNKIFEIYSLLQNQDIHRQKIERVINTMSAISVLMNDTLNSVRTFTPSAKHIIGDKSTDDVVGNDDIEALIASMK